MKNPALRQESRYEPATVIPLKQETSLVDWLQANNRLISREVIEDHSSLLTDDEEISELMDVDDDPYLDEDDDFEPED